MQRAQTIRQILKQHPLSRGADLRAFLQDIEYLVTTRLDVSRVRARLQDGSTCRLLVTGDAGDSLSSQESAAQLTALWIAEMAYAEQRRWVDVSAGEVRLDFITYQGGVCVTGRIVISTATPALQQDVS